MAGKDLHTSDQRCFKPFGSVLVLLVCLACAMQAVGQDEVSLWPRFEEGQKARYNFWSDRTTNAKVSNGQQSRTQSRGFSMEGEVTWVVDSVKADGSAKCTMTYGWIKATTIAPDGSKQVNDSRKGSGEVPPLHAFLKAITGKPLTVDISAKGKASNLKGDAAIRSAMPNPEMAPESVELLATIRTLAILDQPPADMVPGKSWQVESDLPHEMGRMKYKSKYTLEEVGDIEGVPVATLTTQDKLKFTPEIPETPPGMTVAIRMKSADANGTVMYDLDRHETAGRHEYERTVIESKVSAQGRTVLQEIEETRQSQLLRRRGIKSLGAFSSA